jgi:uncharacterized membrane protein
MRDFLLALGVFLACTVESVEALTIVLAVGVVRGWRSTWLGIGAALVTLTAIVLLLGPSLTAIPISYLRTAVGLLLLVFGLQWLRKAILRAGGYVALHDEDAIYDRQTTAAKAASVDGRFVVDDWYAFTISFKGVLLEGLEIAFIVVTFGANQHNVALAAVAAVAAIVVVTAVGVALRHPLATVPENTIKFGVGVMLVTFGMFWAAEGAAMRWPGGDSALLGLAVVVLLSALAMVVWCRREHDRQQLASAAVQ